MKRLFELEVPEIVDGVVELKAIAREPGHRTKIAVASNDHNVDPVGACVGARGSRVRMVVNELRGEKVDIVPYSDDPAEFVMKALAPARVREVRIHADTGTAEVIVPDFQLSLAIGKEGQNARLAARLTGWRVDIKSETQLAEEESGGGVEYAEGEWVENASGELVWQPAEGGEAISAAEAGLRRRPIARRRRADGRRRRRRAEAPAAAADAGRRRDADRPRRRRDRRPSAADAEAAERGPRRAAGRAPAADGGRGDRGRRGRGGDQSARAEPVRTCVGCRRTAAPGRAGPDRPRRPTARCRRRPARSRVGARGSARLDRRLLRAGGAAPGARAGAAQPR